MKEISIKQIHQKQKESFENDVERKFQKILKAWEKIEGEVKVRQQFEAPLFSGSNVFCPICLNYFPESEFLKTVFADERTRWLANMVTHYRHTHITSWNKCWGYGGRYYRTGWFGDYDEEKEKVNERAKRQIIRKCTKYLIFNVITVDHFLELQNTSSETVELATKKLTKKQD